MKTVDLKTALANNLKLSLIGVSPEEVVKAFSGETPTTQTALLAGIECWGWYHPHWGLWCDSFNGEVRVRLQNGSVWRLKGLHSKSGPHDVDIEPGKIMMEKVAEPPNYWQLCEELIEEANRLQDEDLWLEATEMQSRLLAGLPPYPEKGEEE